MLSLSVELFIENSEGLVKEASLIHDQTDQYSEDDPNIDAGYMHKTWPEWFTKGVKSSNKQYEIKADETGHNWGFMKVDEKNKMVYICVIWS